MSSVSRAVQRVAEKMNVKSASKYSSEFEQGCELMEAAGEGTEDLAERLRDHLKSLLSGRLMLSERLSEAARLLASGLNGGSVYSGCLQALAKAHNAVGMVERAYAREVEGRVIAALDDWHDSTFLSYKKERAELEKLRLDMDAAAAKAREKGDDCPELKVAQESRTREHKAKQEVIQGYLDALPRDLNTHKTAAATFLSLQRRLHSDSRQELDIAIKAMADRLNAK